VSNIVQKKEKKKKATAEQAGRKQKEGNHKDKHSN
jgi:hypothetical protein